MLAIHIYTHKEEYAQDLLSAQLMFAEWINEREEEEEGRKEEEKGRRRRREGGGRRRKMKGREEKGYWTRSQEGHSFKYAITNFVTWSKLLSWSQFAPFKDERWLVDASGSSLMVSSWGSSEDPSSHSRSFLPCSLRACRWCCWARKKTCFSATWFSAAKSLY